MALVEKITINLNRKVSYKKGKNYSYQSILFDSVQQLANFILDKRKDVRGIFVIPKTSIERDDDLELRDQILKMSPAERKKLGINKSTLWYMKKNIEAGKSIKIYNKVYSKLAEPELALKVKGIA